MTVDRGDKKPPKVQQKGKALDYQDKGGITRNVFEVFVSPKRGGVRIVLTRKALGHSLKAVLETV